MDDISGMLSRHPYLIAGGVFLVGAIVVYYIFSPSAAPDTGASAFYGAQGAAIQSANQLAAVQAGGQVAVAGFQADVEKNAANASAAIALAQIAANSSDMSAQLGARTQDRGFATADLSNTLAAQVAGEQIASDTKIADINANQQIQLGTIMANELVTAHSLDTGVAYAALADKYAIDAASAGTAQFNAKAAYDLAVMKASGDYNLATSAADQAAQSAAMLHSETVARDAASAALRTQAEADILTLGGDYLHTLNSGVLQEQLFALLHTGHAVGNVP